MIHLSLSELLSTISSRPSMLWQKAKKQSLIFDGCIIVYTPHTLFMHLSVDGHLDIPHI